VSLSFGVLRDRLQEDRLGLDTMYLQAKRWEAQVGRPIVQAFAGSLDGKHARKGVMITTSTFSADARAFVKAIEKRIVLLDGAELARLMFDVGVGVAEAARPYVLKRIDLDFFEEARRRGDALIGTRRQPSEGQPPHAARRPDRPVDRPQG
jgi:restriction system protein